MVVVERHGRVVAPAEAVWDVVRRAETLPRWLAGVTRCEQDGDGHGARRRMTGGTGAVVRARIIAYREPSLIAWRECADADAPGDPPPVPIARVSTELHVELCPDGTGTLIRLIWVHRPGGFWRGLAVRLFRTRRIAHDLDHSLAVLAAGRMRHLDDDGPQDQELAARVRREQHLASPPRAAHERRGQVLASPPRAAHERRDDDLAARMRRLDAGFAVRMRRDGDSAAGGADRGAGMPEPHEPGAS
ncbi:uncharacterized protein YndB with AHSA1/START domain [Catenuloplanes nepalensis]|uniref:Uncharacterized protein YndB with AHSA1/START domain n=1 Tax=Catenuloplanes nepalensis TaxID=587533 RepID=A0ABT9MKD3_9ACTN|nr:SRPBCC family protein [Catenuloplanes nepalensis]MDP9791748.1 uncharacterized protein YndB with AHSA1/START domain [Catenuloplanes nepalensis]